LTVVGVAVVLAYVPAVIATITNRVHDDLWWWIIAPAGVMVAGLILQVLTSRAKKRETAAGYTTLRTAHVELDQLDPRSGDVVRKAGEPYLSQHRLLSGFTSTKDAQPQSASGRPSFVRRATNIAIRVGGSVGIPLVASIIWGSRDPVVATWVGIIAALALVAWVVGLAIGAGMNRARLAALTALDPQSLVFTIISADQFDDAFLEIAPDSAPRYPPVTLGASASQKGLSLWNGRPPEQFGFIPWSWITSIQIDTIYRNRTTYPSVLLSIRDPEDGKLVALPLPNPNADLLPMPSKAEASWIASELNQLRTTKTAARLI
ncbi:MAG: hypothetical protein QOD50_1756, partial [Actinomycetota bacterium]|nr:hypothetical protein [Actinomycetota bacterium]